MEMTQEQREEIRKVVKELGLYAIENLNKQDKAEAFDKIDTIIIMVCRILHHLKTPEEYTPPMTTEEKNR